MSLAQTYLLLCTVPNLTLNNSHRFVGNGVPFAARDAQMDYKAYIVNENDHFIGVHDIEAPNDDAALQEAKQYVNGLAVEVWHRGRRIARLINKSGERDL